MANCDCACECDEVTGECDCDCGCYLGFSNEFALGEQEFPDLDYEDVVSDDNPDDDEFCFFRKQAIDRLEPELNNEFEIVFGEDGYDEPADLFLNCDPVVDLSDDPIHEPVQQQAPACDNVHPTQVVDTELMDDEGNDVHDCDDDVPTQVVDTDLIDDEGNDIPCEPDTIREEETCVAVPPQQPVEVQCDSAQTEARKVDTSAPRILDEARGDRLAKQKSCRASARDAVLFAKRKEGGAECAPIQAPIQDGCRRVVRRNSCRVSKFKTPTRKAQANRIQEIGEWCEPEDTGEVIEVIGPQDPPDGCL